MDRVECPICLMSISRRLTFLNCSHKICLDCAVRWLYKKNICPICRDSSSTFLVFDSTSTFLLKKDQTQIKQNLENTHKQLQVLEASSSKQEDTQPNNQTFSEQSMSLSKLISTYWEEICSNLVIEDKQPNNDFAEIDISVFSGNLNEVIYLTSSIWDNMIHFDSHIFYSELYDVIEDIHRTNNFYQEGLQERDPSLSKMQLACYLEHVFKFLENMNQSILQRDTGMINYLLKNVDEVYFNGYIEYYFRDELENNEIE